jgi:hypothetical protein
VAAGWSTNTAKHPNSICQIVVSICPAMHEALAGWACRLSMNILIKQSSLVIVAKWLDAESLSKKITKTTPVFANKVFQIILFDPNND